MSIVVEHEVRPGVVEIVLGSSMTIEWEGSVRQVTVYHSSHGGAASAKFPLPRFMQVYNEREYVAPPSDSRPGHTIVRNRV